MLSFASDRPIRVVVADDEPLIRGGIVALLGAASDLVVVGEAAHGEEVLAQVGRLRPHVVVMDLRMPGLDGIETTRALTQDPTGQFVDQPTRVLVLTTFRDDESVYGALRAGASGFLTKSQPHYLVQAVRAVGRGDAFIDPAIASQVLDALVAAPQVGPPSAVLDRLTRREQEILALVASGLSNENIRRRLVLSEATVRTHVSRILMKTGVRDRAQAVALAYQSGLVRATPR